MPFSPLVRLRIAAAACVLAVTPTAPAHADPLPGIATPEPIATEASGTSCRYPDFVTLDDAFAKPVTDIVTLRFISYVESLAPSDQVATLKRIERQDLPQAHTEISAVEQIGCPLPQIAARTARLLYSITARWVPANTSDALVSDARWAIGALQIRDRIGRSILDAQLAKFGTSYAALSGPDPETACYGNTDAKPIKAVQPPYPSFAGANAVGGTILVDVSLDSEGFVTAASVSKRDVPAGEAGDELARVSLAAAAASTYAPAIAACKPVAGSYIFKADFHVKH